MTNSVTRVALGIAGLSLATCAFAAGPAADM